MPLGDRAGNNQFCKPGGICPWQTSAALRQLSLYHGATGLFENAMAARGQCSNQRGFSAAGTARDDNALYHSIGLRSLKNPPDGPLSGNVASQIAVSAASSG